MAPLEDGFVPGAETLDIRVVPVDDQGACGSRSGQFDPGRMKNQPRAYREHDGSEDRAGGDVFGRGDGNEEYDGRPKHREGHEVAEGSCEGRDGLAALELEEHRKYMTGADSEGGERHPIIVAIREPLCDGDRERSFENVEEQSGDAEFLSGGAKNVCGSDITATRDAHVAARGCTGQQIAERDGA